MYSITPQAQLTRPPRPVNEPVKSYAPESTERDSLKSTLKQMSRETVDIPLFIDGREIRTGNTRNVVLPHDHDTVVATFHLAGEKELEMAAQAALQAKADWEGLSPQARMGVFLKAAELLRGPWRDKLNASTMLGQSKSVHQAEIDAACELIDFFRFNCEFYKQILDNQPLSTSEIWNTAEYRALEGFVLAITPFNFTSIAANLPAAPALLGNTAVWKASDTQMLSAYYTMKLFEAAGLPPGVINLVAADGPLTSQVLVKHPDLAGVHFTGSTATFQTIFKTVGENISRYKTYPRLVGETGGKDFIFAHESAGLNALATAIVRGGFEFQGQKCSAASRIYIPRNLWPELKDRIYSDLKSISVGDVQDFRHFMNAVIDDRSFQKITGYIEGAKADPQNNIVYGGKYDAKKGYFIDPTVIETKNPQSRTMVEEIFGPVVTVYVYPEQDFEATLKLCDQSSPYALTGAIFAQDRRVIELMKHSLRNSAGNFYINDKPTGAVVGQQPFGGARASGTNDKAGSLWNLIRWTSPRTIKEVFDSPTDYRYPFLGSQ